MNAKRVLSGLALTLAVSLALLLYPAYVIRPFRHQGPTELRYALAILEVRPWLEALLGLLAMGALLWAWHLPLRRRVVAIGLAALTFASAALSHVNIYEKMFHPLQQPTFASIAQTKLDGREQVIAIALGPIARAYPIRVISYHHVVNDAVAGFPVVATY